MTDDVLGWLQAAGITLTAEQQYLVRELFRVNPPDLQRALFAALLGLPRKVSA